MKFCPQISLVQINFDSLHTLHRSRKKGEEMEITADFFFILSEYVDKYNKHNNNILFK